MSTENGKAVVFLSSRDLNILCNYYRTKYTNRLVVPFYFVGLKSNINKHIYLML